MSTKKLPIGISDFKNLIEKNYYYVDKSLFIEEIIEDGAAVLLLPRPRRFGKTLNLSMLRYFLEKTVRSNSHLFENLAITKNKELMKEQGAYPVIYITFKDIKVTTWEECLEGLKNVITAEYRRHRYLSESEALYQDEKSTFISVITKKASIVDFQESLKNLSEYLHRHHKKRPFILIDEYDTPIQSGYLNNYKEDIVGFMRNLLSGGLKDNINLEKGVLTGILRVSKENIFSGMNNLKVCGITRNAYADKFGLTHNEVSNLVKKVSGSDKYIDDVRSWYNGYRIGKKVTVYNPWSIINFLDHECEFGPYWINTSDNALINQLIINGGETFRNDLKKITLGQTIKKVIDDNIVFDHIDHDLETVWSLLLFSGYLTYEKRELIDEDITCWLKIPNREVSSFFKKAIIFWFKKGVGTDSYDHLLSSLIEGQIDIFTKTFQNILLSSTSYFDPAGNDPEKVYHAFVLGILMALRNTHEVKSNRESGHGRYDVMITPKDISKLGIVIEFKVAKEEKTLAESAQEALQQIETHKYVQDLDDREIKKKLLIGMAFCGKRMKVKYRMS